MRKLQHLLFLTITISICASWVAYNSDESTPITSNLHDTSPLSDGTVYKIAIDKTGMYKITGSWLSSNLNVPVSSIDPNFIQIFGNGGGVLPEGNAESRPQSLEELAIWVDTGSDSVLDEEDFILFYAEDEDKWRFDPTSSQFRFEKNIYDTQNYYFLKIGHEIGKRITEQEVFDSPTNVINQYRNHQVYHKDEVNLLAIAPSNQGSGQTWYGEELSNLGTYNVDSKFNLDHIITTESQRLKVRLVGRSERSESVRLAAFGQVYTVSNNPVDIGEVEALHAREIDFDEIITIGIANKNINIDYQKNSTSARLWLDFAQMEFAKKVVFEDASITFNNFYALDKNHNGIALEKTLNVPLIYWDITDLNDIKSVPSASIDNSHESIPTQNDHYQEFIAFDIAAVVNEPIFVKTVVPQDLGNLFSSELIILYHENFQSPALELAAHRRKHSGLTVTAVNVEAVFNEFSSGKKDPTAIRDFAKFLYDRDPNFQYLLLFGDASHDFRGLNASTDYQNFVPTYETRESLDPLEAFPSDDYFALLDENEGGELRGDLDISVGRITVRTAAEAQNVLNKITNYDINPEARGDWRLDVAFLADDEDNNLHLNDADRIARSVAVENPQFNQEKIYWDAFRQESTPGGNRYPEATEKLNSEINEGLLVVNYLGHGGPRGWSQERVLNLDNITSWSNINKLPLIITATCSFTGYDDPSLTTAGESTLLNPTGGAIALFTTVRSVFASKNFRLTQAVFQRIFEKEDNQYLPIGDILRRSKNANPSDNVNARKFLLIGDPSLKLSIPQAEVRTTLINQTVIESNEDKVTVGALEKVSIAGTINGLDGSVIQDFDGILNIQVFDKVSEVQTLKNDVGSFVRNFDVQKNVIFEGIAAIEGGNFNFSFVVPVDINYAFGDGKISYYAFADNGTDAGGASESLIIGGTADLPILDDQGPTVSAYIGDVTFQNGDDTGPNPLIFAELKDDFGINISNSSIGHEIIAVLDEDTKSTLILNDRFEPKLNDFTSGQLSFQLEELEIGPHTLNIKAFDTSNNPGEVTISFNVVGDLANKVTEVSNRPNPFENQTSFSFSHNLSAQILDVRINVMDITGRLVSQQTTTKTSQNGMVDDILWGATGVGQNQLPSGVYLYSIEIRPSGERDFIMSDIKKMMILK